MPDPTTTDVLIVGSGSAGLCAAVWLARLNIPFIILERRDGPLKVGQADGVQTRTVEIFDSFGLAEDMLREAYHVLEIAFWGAEAEGETGIARQRYAADLERGVSHQPHVILNQARVNQLMMGDVARSRGELGEGIEYGVEVTGVEVEGEEVRVQAVKGGEGRVYKAKYVLGCDGAHSIVRKSLGYRMVGDSSDAVWGVMDIYPRTSFPDIRKKVVVHAASGNILVIPREGDAMVRFYIELPRGTRPADVTLAVLHERARLAFRPYDMEFAETAWWSAYAIGQRHADFFHKDHRVFLTGDACHTHSPKAGQGMNVSLQDGYNIGWKLGMVLRGLAGPGLLETYVLEREKTAVDLIEFDRHFTQLFSSKYRQENGITAEHFAEQFVKAGRYTAGQAVKYGESAITVAGEKDKAIASGVEVGMRFPSAVVVRFADAKAMQLVKALPGNGQWFAVVFAGDLTKKEAAERLDKASKALESIANDFTPSGYDPDTIIDRILVLSGNRKGVEQEQIPEFFTPTTGQWKMKCLMKTFVDDEGYNSAHGHAYKSYGVDPEQGAVVIVRPDHYVAKITTLEEVESLRTFFGGFLKSCR